MEIQLVRNATMKIRYGSVSFVTDPLLAPRLTMKSYAGRSPNPLVDMPLSPQEVLKGAEMVLLSHIHSDHFDLTAQKFVAADLPILCQPADLERIQNMGFSDVRPVATELTYKDIRITRVDGSHGQGAVLGEMGVVSGYVLASPEEPTVYWAGDTVLYDQVFRTINEHTPAVIITHSSGAVWGSRKDLIVMDASQTVEVSRYAQTSVVIAIHMDALDHGTVTRSDLKNARQSAEIPTNRLRIPLDGEKMIFARTMRR